jgi:hypothetical protein
MCLQVVIAASAFCTCSSQAGKVLPCLEVLPCWRDSQGVVHWGNAADAEQVALARAQQLNWQFLQQAAGEPEAPAPDSISSLESQEGGLLQGTGEGPAAHEATPLVLTVVIENLL